MSKWKLYYHFVWGTENRQPVIPPEFQEALYNTMSARAKDLGGTVHAIGGTEDHIHLVVSVLPSISLEIFLSEVRKNSERYTNRILKPEVEFSWQDDYSVVSFEERNLPLVVQYVKNQQQHHAEGSMVEYLEIVG